MSAVPETAPPSLRVRRSSACVATSIQGRTREATHSLAVLPRWALTRESAISSVSPLARCFPSRRASRSTVGSATAQGRWRRYSPASFALADTWSSAKTVLAQCQEQRTPPIVRSSSTTMFQMPARRSHAPQRHLNGRCEFRARHAEGSRARRAGRKPPADGRAVAGASDPGPGSVAKRTAAQRSRSRSWYGRRRAIGEVGGTSRRG